MDLSTIVITWMDGTVKTYEDATASVRDGELHIHVYRRGIPTEQWHFPISNIRARGPRRWEANHAE